MLTQLTVNPPTETYKFIQAVNLPVFVGTEVTQPSKNQIRMAGIKSQINGALNVASDAAFYLRNNTEDVLTLLRESVRKVLDTNAAVIQAVIASTEQFSIETVLASSRDGCSESITVSLFAGQTRLLTETRTVATNSYTATAQQRLSLNNIAIV